MPYYLYQLQGHLFQCPFQDLQLCPFHTLICWYLFIRVVRGVLKSLCFFSVQDSLVFHSLLLRSIQVQLQRARLVHCGFLTHTPLSDTNAMFFGPRTVWFPVSASDSVDLTVCAGWPYSCVTFGICHWWSVHCEVWGSQRKDECSSVQTNWLISWYFQLCTRRLPDSVHTAKVPVSDLWSVQLYASSQLL